MPAVTRSNDKDYEYTTGFAGTPSSTPQAAMQFKIYESYISRIFYLLFSDHSRQQTMKPQVRGDNCTCLMDASRSREETQMFGSSKSLPWIIASASSLVSLLLPLPPLQSILNRQPDRHDDKA